MRVFYILLFCIFFKKIDAEPKPDLPTDLLAILTDGICKDLFTNVTIGDKPTKSLGYTILHETCLKSQDVVQTVTKYLNMNIDALFDRDVACRDLTRTVRSVCRKFVNKEACNLRIVPKEFIKQCKVIKMGKLKIGNEKYVNYIISHFYLQSMLDVYVCKIRPGQAVEGTSPSDILGSIVNHIVGKK
ncbi:hypothetical protein TKK_0003279 [Trichogramma kaykai]